ncbi:Uncharacterised protein [Cedecea lapagei]|uniref:Uncharacterized protein n=1 Tax=Cedecea lapagei TaxID=158823 RepID=A0A3S4JBE9_9ENTR|nr:hypothetical protein [Cedecea lapagei]VEB97252.1 Uncharacterised protein [Cedecea lapagei]
MSEYGVFFLTESGQPFITPSSTPMALHSKRSIPSHQNGTSHVVNENIQIDTSMIIMPFVLATAPAVGSVACAVSKQNGFISVSGSNMAGHPFSLDVYIFAIFPQPMPASKYGVAIWDSSGKLILTHETKVLTDLITVGQRGTSNSGITIDETLSGRWAIAPEMTGQLIYNANGRPSSVSAYTSAIYANGNTRVTSSTSSSGAGELIGVSSNWNSITAVNVSQYD